MDKLIRWSLENRVVVLLGACLLLAWGTWTALHMPVDVFPDLTAPTVTVLTEAHGLPAQEVEILVTFPIEATMNGAAGVRRVRSSSASGISIVWVEFEWGTDIYLARQVVSEKLQLMSAALPHGVDAPVLAPIASIMGEIMFIGMEADGVTLREARSEADWNVRRRLLSVPGVAQVIPVGGEVKQFHVVVIPERLKTYRVGLNTVIEAVRASNKNVGAGVLIEGSQEYLIRGVGRIHSVEELGSVVVAMRESVPVLLRHVADVKIDSAFRRGAASINAEPAVMLTVLKQPGVNTLTLTASIDAALDDIEKTLPEGITINRNSFRQASFIDTAIRNISSALRNGAILVIVVVFLFLANFRATVITLTALPLSILAAVLVVDAMGGTLNTMTLGGLTIAIGSLMDNAIIGVENAARRLRENYLKPAEERTPFLDVIYEALRGIRKAIVLATLIIILVFLPLFFLSGVEGRLLQPLGIAYVVSLLASLIVALTVTPALCFLFLTKRRGRGNQERKEGIVAKWLTLRYSKDIEKVLRFPSMVLTISVVGILAAISAVPFLGRSFLPEFNEGALTVAAVTLPGTTLDKSDEIGRRVEKALLAFPEVTSTSRRTGRAELDEHALGVNASEIEVVLRETERSREVFLAEVRRELGQIQGVVINVGQPISHRIDHMLSGTRAAIAVKIFGKDLQRLQALAARAKNALLSIDGLVDVSAGQLVQVPQISVRYDTEAMARYGVTAYDLSEKIEAVFRGESANRVLEGRKTYDIVVRYPAAVRKNIETLRNAPIDTPSGSVVPLKALADISYDSGPHAIKHENVQRKAVVSANVAGLDLHTAVREIRKALEGVFADEPGYHYELGGQFESEARATRIILGLSMVVIVVIYFLLYLAFDSFKAAAIVMFNLPLSLLGGVAAVFLTGGVLDVASLGGFIALFGVAVRNGVLLISRYQQLLSAGMALREAIVRGSLERLVPVLMTALTTGLALLPLILGMGEPGNEIQAPIAVVIFGGLITSTVLNMVVLPVLSLKFGIERREHHLLTKTR